MSSPDAFNFGRRIKDLKRSYNKTYADLTAGLKISRERIVQLEENEREPTEVERKRFADFYALPAEELGLSGGGVPVADPNAAAPRPRPTPPPGNTFDSSPRPNPNFNNRPSGDYGNARPPYSQPQPSFNDRPNYGGGSFDNRQGDNVGNNRPPNNYDQGNDRRPNYGNFDNRQGDNMGNNRPPNNYGDRPQRPPNNFGDRPQRPPNNFGDRPQQRPPNNNNMGNNRPAPTDADRPARPAKPPQAPRPKVDKAANTGEPKPVMKYTAEQLGDIESAYLRKQRDLKVPLKFTFMNGKEYTGVVVDFTPFTVHIIEQDTNEEVILRKLAMAYYRKADAVEEARQAATQPEKSEEA